MTRRKKQKCNTESGILYILEVYNVEKTVKIGTGLGYKFRWGNARPTLIDNDGNPLPECVCMLKTVGDGILSVFYIGEDWIN